MNSKVKNLQEKTKVFHALLESNSDDDDALRLLQWLAPLFSKIEEGSIEPPHKYAFRLALGKDSGFYEKHKNISSAESDFIAALEDWTSQSWYKNLK